MRSRLYYIWKKLSEQQSRKKFNRDNNKDDIARFRACTTKKPAPQIRREMKALHQYWGCYPYQYYRFDFFRADCPLSVEEMKTYVPHFFIMSLYFPHSYKDYGVLCEDKLLTAALLKAYNVPQPNLLGCYDHNGFFDAANTPLTAESFNAVINGSQAQKLFIKPRFGLGGRGILVFNKNAAGPFVDESNVVLEHGYLKKLLGRDAYIIQEGLVQHDALNTLYPQAINTFRIMTECVQGEVTVMYALVRMGSGGQQIDNASSGGLYIKIDPQTGLLAAQAFAFNRIRFDKHPDTQFVFDGAHITVWEEAKNFTIALAKKFREIRFMGWDIAVTKNGPAVIELNNAPGIGIIQDCYGGIRDDLKISPAAWWRQSKYTIKNL